MCGGTCQDEVGQGLRNDKQRNMGYVGCIIICLVRDGAGGNDVHVHLNMRWVKVWLVRVYGIC
jgi:hypothetical protein